MPDTTTYDELKALMEMSKPSMGSRIAEAGRALGYGLQGKSLDYKPLAPQDDTAKNLMKAIMLEKVKKRMGIEQLRTKADLEAEQLQKVLGGTGVVGQRAVPEGFELGGVKYKIPQSQEQFESELARKKEEQLQNQELKSYISPAKQQEDLQKAQLAYNNLQFMKEKAERLPAGYASLGGNIANFVRRGESNPQLALYEKELPAMAVAIYRDVTGDTRLSDQDARERAYPLLWNPARGEGGSIRSGSFADLDKLYQARIRLLQKGKYKPNPKDSTEMITPIEDVIAEAKLSQSNTSIDQFQIGQTINKNGITYTYKGNGQWEY
jgi:hypothetical protein